MNSVCLKEAALYWLRYEKNLTHVCTEFGQWCADVMGACKTRLVEIEIKTHVSDLRRDIKKRKHLAYRAEESHLYSDAPNYFFFMVPPELEAEAVKVAEQINPAYGVVVYNPMSEFWSGRFKVVSRSRRLHSRAPQEKVFERMAARMSTEIVAAHMLKNAVSSARDWVSDELKKRFVPAEKVEESQWIWDEVSV